MKTKIKIKNLTKTFNTSSGLKKALDDISLEIFEGDFIVLGGENGSGKSLLMSIISGLVDADSNERSLVRVEERVGLVFQEAETQILGETPREDIAFGPKNLGWNKERIQVAVNEALEETGLMEKADFPARFLSGGEKRRLAIACMLAMDLNIIILDEPFANLDFCGVKQVNSLLQKLKSKGKTIIVLTHEIEKCLALANRFVVLFRGKKVFDGGCQEALLQNLEQWNIRNPLTAYSSLQDLLW